MAIQQFWFILMPVLLIDTAFAGESNDCEVEVSS